MTQQERDDVKGPRSATPQSRQHGSRTPSVFNSVAAMSAVAFFAIALTFLYRTPFSNSADSENGTGSAHVSQAINTCGTLQHLLGPSLVKLPSDAEYAGLREENWSQTAWRHPSCIVSPTGATEVAKALNVLVNDQVQFAIRSGGHSPMPSDSNIDTGVLISLDKLDKVSYDAETGLASLSPGARWDAVYTELDKYNVTIVGGRVMNVGVGGLTLGSGLSYLSDLYGLVCDNIVSYEVVLADGRIVEASVNSNSDLFWGLKGGGNNFGIVTKFEAKTYPIVQTWGGIQVFSLDQTPALLQALHEYQTTPNKDPYANMVINLVPTNGTTLLTLVYLKPVERPAAYAPFYALSPVFEQTGFMTLHQLMALFPASTLPRWTWYVHGFQPDSALYGELATLFTTAPEIATIGALQGGSLIAAVQPISADSVRAGRASNGGVGNALGLQAVDQTWWSISVAWWNATDDAAAYAAAASMAGKIGAAAAAAGAGLDYIFMNDANTNQSVIASYGETNVRRMQAVQKIYDPNLVFQKLVPGGQKIPTYNS
ncbi:putative FAD-binding oxidoreductase [Hypomontagnella monticulosa]|nr:putative FAD-binding oxidoreductase [Hypomontagnella monticulosa]